MNLPLYPAPVRMEETAGHYRPSLKATLSVAPGAMSGARASEICDLWRRFACTAGTLSIREDASLPAHTARMGTAEIALKPEDAYAIRVTNEGACVAGRDDLSLLHGLFTLLQLLRPLCLEAGAEELAIDCAEIHDHPVLRHRSLHVCVFPETTLEVLERTIRLAAFTKFTHIVLEFWGTLRLDCFPELGWADHSFTKAQLRPLIALANALGLEIIPMINHLGHATQSRGCTGRHTILDQNPRLALLFEPDGWTFCLSNPKVHTLLREVRAELIDLCGPGEYFHLGCDEAYSYASCPLCREKDKPGMLADYLNGLSEELAAQGRRGIIWGDALLDNTAWKSPHIATSRPDQQTHLALERLDRRLIIADWQYYLKTPEMPTAEYFKGLGFEVLACPWDDNGNATALAAAADRLSLPGVMVTTWHHLQAMLRNLHELGASAWSGEAYQSNPGQWVQCAALLRKVMPEANCFDRSGFLPQETDPVSIRSI